jgi:hypothetical protein
MTPPFAGNLAEKEIGLTCPAGPAFLWSEPNATHLVGAATRALWQNFIVFQNMMATTA